MLGNIHAVNIDQVRRPQSEKNNPLNAQAKEQVQADKILRDKITIDTKVKNISALYRTPGSEGGECDSVYDLLARVLEEQGVIMQTPSGDVIMDTHKLEPAEAQDLIFSFSHLQKLKYGFPKRYLIYDKRRTFYQSTFIYSHEM